MSSASRPTEKQQRYLLFLLDKAGYSTRYMNAEFKSLGATMRERSGMVTNWVAGLNLAEASAVIDTLKKKLGE